MSSCCSVSSRRGPVDIRFEHYPPIWAPWLLAILSYANFFTHHYVLDIRLSLFALSAVLLGRTWFQFTPDLQIRRMPMLLGALLVATSIWLAENLGTFASAWVYPSQRHGWSPVPIEKIGSWYLLIILSFVLVSLVHGPAIISGPPQSHRRDRLAKGENPRL